MGIPTPDQLINCNGLGSCLQSLYNFFFGILVALAFVYFLWGAIEYLLSGSTITSKESGKKKMINSIIALIVTLLLPVIVNWINPEIFESHELEVYEPEFEGDAFDVDNPTGTNNVNRPTGTNNVNRPTGTPTRTPTSIRGRCLVDPRRTDLVSLNTLRLKNIKEKRDGSVCVNKAIVGRLQAIDEKLTFPIYITQGYNGPSSGYNKCHEAGKALDIIIDGDIKERQNIPKWKTLIDTIKRSVNNDPNVSVLAEARCDYLCNNPRLTVTCHGPTDKCIQTCTEKKNGYKITWCQRPRTSGSPATGGRHLHVCFDRRVYIRR